MIDLETLGLKPGSVVLAIGAVKFDPKNDPTGLQISLPKNRLSICINIESSLAWKMSVDASTLYWWLKQSDEARAALAIMPTGLPSALAIFDDFFKGSAFLWGHGAAFDPPMLAAAYNAISAETPWHYSNVRDTRTLFALTGSKVVQDETTKHNALADAEAQAFAVLKAYQALGGGVNHD